MIAALINLIIYCIVLGIVVWLVLYLIDAIPLPEPFHRIVRVAIIVVASLIVILLLLNFVGVDIGGPPRLVR